MLENDKIFDFSSGESIGKIGSKAGTFQVWKVQEKNEIVFGAIEYTPGLKNSEKPENPVCFLGFYQASDNARNAWTNKDFKRKGIASELFYLIKEGLLRPYRKIYCDE